MDGLIENIKIAGIASCVPRHTEDNMDYGNVLGEKRVKKQVKLTGIRKRHTSRIEQRASDLAICAANDLLTKLDWKKDEIGVLDLYDSKSGLLNSFYGNCVTGAYGFTEGSNCF